MRAIKLLDLKRETVRTLGVKSNVWAGASRPNVGGGRSGAPASSTP
jgi:hypothetical protein